MCTQHHQRSKTRSGRRSAAALLAVLALPTTNALTLPSFGAGVVPSAKKAKRAASRGSHQILKSSAGLTIEDGPSGLWKIRSDGFAFDNHRNNGSSSSSRRKGKGPGQQTKRRPLVPFGPVPRGGSLSDIAILPSANAASAALELEQGPWSGVKRGARGVRRRVLKTVVNLNGALRFGGREERSREDEGGTALEAAATTAMTVEERRSPLRIGGAINRRLRRRRSVHVKTGAISDSAVLAVQSEAVADIADMDAWAELESAMMSASSAATVEAADGDDPFSLPFVGRLFQRKDVVSLDDDVVGMAYEEAALASRGGASAVAAKTSTTSVAPVSPISSTSRIASVDSMETYVIETPLFPIILPKAWEPPVAASSSVTVERTATLEISVAIEEEIASVATDAKPSPQLLAAATQPLLPKDVVDTFTGREFYYPETIEALTTTGMKMTLGQGANPWVDWSGEKKTEAFLRNHGVDGVAGTGKEWYDALDASQEVLVWVGKFASKDGYGAELPIIKTTSIINKSPKYLAELLMDSERVKIYNKMSLGRTDEKVFQTGIETQGGEFGDGESKVVRNLTKPPMVSSLIEFVTCMHARRLRPDDASILGSDEPAEGYLVVSRAVTGGEWSAGNTKSSGGEKLSRNEILMGTNILRSVPGDPDKTELTAITHVYSPMIPQMLARSAGVKGAVDFVRDMRALP